MAAASTTKPDDEKASDAKFVAFKGHNGVRTISKAEWEAIDIKTQDDVVWSRSNGWRVPTSDLNTKAMNYVMNVDGEFELED